MFPEYRFYVNILVEVILNTKMIIRSFNSGDRNSIVQLWKDCGLVVPWNNPQLDIERKSEDNPEEILVGLINDDVVASAIVGYDGHRGWVYYLAVHPQHQRKGLGNQIMKYAENHLLKSGCPKINIMVRMTNLNVIKFYESIGYKKENIVTLGKRLIPDN